MNIEVIKIGKIVAAVTTHFIQETSYCTKDSYKCHASASPTKPREIDGISRELEEQKPEIMYLSTAGM